MKLQTFVLLIVAISAAGVFGLYLACKSSDKPADKPKEEAKKDTPAPPPPKQKEEAPPPAKVVEDPKPVKAEAGSGSGSAVDAKDDKSDLAARPHDAEVLAWKDKTIPGDKEKDTSKGKAYKVAVYKDAGKTNVNRAKVDLNRNGKDDEKYSFEPDKITLQRAPADDEKYTETYRWNGRGWTKK